MKRFNKTNGMYALLIAVAAMIGVTIYGSCSADEDYGDYSSRDELFTLADGIMGRGEVLPINIHDRIYQTPRVYVKFRNLIYNINDSCEISFIISTTDGFSQIMSEVDCTYLQAHPNIVNYLSDTITAMTVINENVSFEITFDLTYKKNGHERTVSGVYTDIVPKSMFKRLQEPI